MTNSIEGSAPRERAPAGACDTHMHIYDPRFAPLPGTNFPAQPATLADYLRVKERLGLSRTVVVQPTAYGSDNRCTLEAMRALGEARGVAILRPDVTETQLRELHTLGIRGVRYHMLRGGGVTWESLPDMAARIAQYGWHVQVQTDANEFAAREPMLRALPSDLVIDHMGRFSAQRSANDPDWAAFRRLVDTGRCWVKLSAPYYGSKSGPPRYEDMGPLVRELVRAAPERVLWASNWPHPMIQRDFPDEAVLLDCLAHWVDSAATRERILVENPAALYGF